MTRSIWLGTILGVVAVIVVSASAAPGDRQVPDAGRGTDGGASDGGWNDTAVFEALNPTVQSKIVRLRERMATLGRRVYLMSGARPGSPTGSMHNQALAVDVTIDDMSSLEVAAALEAEGFPCAIRYFDRHMKPCHMAHGDLRGTSLARGTYAPGMRRALNCPGAAVSRTDTCDNESKAEWDYMREMPTVMRGR